jgi:hypothetical protein
MLAWRDANMPGKPVWVTEWGWDARLPGEVCNTTLCVSQHAQVRWPQGTQSPATNQQQHPGEALQK